MHASKKQTSELATRRGWRWNARWVKEDEGQGQVVGSRACTVVVVGWIGVVESSSGGSTLAAAAATAGYMCLGGSSKQAVGRENNARVLHQPRLTIATCWNAVSNSGYVCHVKQSPQCTSITNNARSAYCLRTVSSHS